MDYGQHIAAHVRITILRLLESQPTYKLNSSLLCDGCDAMGLPVTRDGIATQLAWLAEQGLVTLDDLGRLVIAKLTARGLDVAHGKARVPGVKPPSP